ncbi:class II fructose-1,6-bisphosphate aldolase [Listeria weihenstephanensis]|uniref:Class II fructose-1,6-bisphosphate aldolase n=1 Tax=Listeria weihenstephanensis TaxID=1006155 RepID=A0A841Z232_9LIST|nr:class II fructose-1,6-bisphosphate aldolase [Listeria weihenstephanensis]MBC1499265.1 class II fructose-1,6-bisphosphate aldolase [Listeria weihenstephanensis]
MLVTLNEVLKKAHSEKYAVGQFNINGLSWIHAILIAAEKEKAPVIIGASDRMIDFLGGFQTITSMVKNLITEHSITIPVVLHLDHGTTVARCKQAIDAGFTSVMFDGSKYPIAENIRLTKDVTDYAHAHGVDVEAEVGTVGGNEDGLIGNINYADLEECVMITKETGIDALAAALGSVHGNYQGEPVLGFREMAAIQDSIQIPLVLHGASGIPPHQIKRAITLGHAKINVNTECNKSWLTAIRQALTENPATHEPQVILEPGREAITATVQAKIQEFGSTGKA